MNPDMITIKGAIVRGGTSKGIYILENELPKDPVLRDKYVLEIFGSPDVRQIDGLGGADVLTSKLAIIGPPSRPDADVDYTFGQVSFVESKVDYASNCGNISAGVAPFAIDMGLVKAVEPVTEVRIHQVNTNTIIVARVRTSGGKSCVDGDCHIDGVTIDGSPIELDLSDSAGAITGKLLPTGNVCDTIQTADGKSYEVTIVDAAIPTVFIRAEALGLTGIEKPAQIEGDAELMQKIEEIRGLCAVKAGILDDASQSVAKSAYAPFFSIVSPAADYDTFDGKHVCEKDIDIVSRLLFMQKMHKTHPGTGTVCMGVAARLPGSVVNRTIKAAAHDREQLVIGHPAGVIPVLSRVEAEGDGFVIRNAAILRTARMIMEGNIFLRKSRIQ